MWFLQLLVSLLFLASLLLLPSPLTLTSNLLLVFSVVPVVLLLLGPPDVPVVSCTTVDPAVADVLNADCIPGVPAVASVSAVAAPPILWTFLLLYVFSTFFLSLLLQNYQQENKLSISSSVNVFSMLKIW
jgi:hypothetical protein